jgi:hypothetical protein
MRIVRLILSSVIFAALIAWGCAALWIDGSTSRPVAAVLAAGFALACLASLIWIRPLRRGSAAFAAIFVAVLIWWFSIPPSNDRDWLPDVARTARAEIDGDIVTISNVRNFDYRTETDYTEHWETRRYDLSKLRGSDFFLIYWGSPMIAHTIVSWDFEDGQSLAISIETRKEKGEEYSALLGFFRQFELYYVVSDERDVVRLRSNYRGENVYLYRLTTPVDEARAVLLDYLKEVNRLDDQPEWYNAMTHNCTTTIRKHAQNVTPGRKFDWRILVNGYIDELGYERGTIDTSLPFAELKRLSNIDAAAQAADQDPAFSERIRDGLPGARH